MRTAVGTSFGSIALNRQKIRPANSTPIPSDIQRTRAVTGGRGPSRSHSVIKPRPTTLRNDSMVSTSQCAAMMILASMSDTPSAIAAASPGAEEKKGRKAKWQALVGGIAPDEYAATASTATTNA